MVTGKGSPSAAQCNCGYRTKRAGPDTSAYNVFPVRMERARNV
ncbi:hypothetical protein [Clostridium sp. 1001283B150225_161107_B6]|nr:hypothetical protein [Clostridium sp. 1001283B150225_161107_B6]